MGRPLTTINNKGHAFNYRYQILIVCTMIILWTCADPKNMRHAMNNGMNNTSKNRKCDHKYIKTFFDFFTMTHDIRIILFDYYRVYIDRARSRFGPRLSASILASIRSR